MKYEKPYMEITLFSGNSICNTLLASGDSSVDSGNMEWSENMGSGGFGDLF